MCRMQAAPRAAIVSASPPLRARQACTRKRLRWCSGVWSWHFLDLGDVRLESVKWAKADIGLIAVICIYDLASGPAPGPVSYVPGLRQHFLIENKDRIIFRKNIG